MYRFLSCAERVSTFLAVVALLVLLIGRFWWPGEGSSWAGVIRISLFLGFVIFLADLCLRREKIGISILWCCFLIFWMYMVVNSVSVAGDWQPVRRLMLIMAFVAGVYLVTKAECWRPVLMASVVVGAIFAALSLVNKYAMGEISLGYRAIRLYESGFPGVAYFGNSIVAGMNYAFCFLGAVWFALCTKGLRARLWWCLLGLIMLVYIYLTYARTSWVACAIGAGVLALLLTEGRARWRLIVTTAIGVLAVLVFGFSALVYEVTQRGLTHRDEIWVSALSRLAGHWWFGHGAGTPLGLVPIAEGSNIVQNTHSLYIEVLFQFGLVGLVLLLMIMALAAWRLFQDRSSLAVFWLAILAAMSAVMLVELRSFVSSPNLVWIWFWLPLGGALAIEMKRQKNAQN